MRNEVGADACVLRCSLGLMSRQHLGKCGVFSSKSIEIAILA